MSTFTKFITITSTALLMAAPLYASDTTEKLSETRKTSSQVEFLSTVLIDDVCFIIGEKLACLEALDKDNKIDSSSGNLAKLGDKLALLTEKWKDIAQKGMISNTPLWKTLHGVTPEDEAIFQIFSKAKLVYKPNVNNDEGKIELLFSKFVNLHNGVFDLSKCDEADKYLRFTTNPSIFFALEEANNAKLNIFMAPHYLINKFITTAAKPFDGIIHNWKKATVPIAFFLRMSSWTNAAYFYYLTTKSVEQLSNERGAILYDATLHRGGSAWRDTQTLLVCNTKCKKFHVCFVNQNKD